MSTMHRNTSILSYFKPFTQPSTLNKRLLPEDSFEEPRAVRRPRSSTPKESQSKERDDGEGVYLDQTLDRTSAKVTLRSSSRRPPSPRVDEPTDGATLAQVFGDKRSDIPLTPSPKDPIYRNPDVLYSQNTGQMSSQRVVKNGEVVIRNSDDESDSDCSFEDLNHLLQLEDQSSRRDSSCPNPQKLASPLPGIIEDERRTSTRRRTKTDTVAAPLPPVVPVQPKKYKFNLESLARRRKQEEASSEDITRANAMLRSFEQQKAPFDTSVIDRVMKEHGEEDEMNRLKAAIQRTEALHRGKSWSFFVERAREPLSEQMEFPFIEDHLERLLRKMSSRQQSFLSGYVGELAMKEQLSEEILLWIMDALCLESRDDLRCSYIVALTNASKHLVSLLSPERIDMLFRKMGATTATLDIEGPVNPQPTLSQSTGFVSRPNLLSILYLFHNLASILSAEIRKHLICTLCRLVLDQSIANSCHIIRSVEYLFASLIESIPEQDLDHELQMVTTTAFTSIMDTTLRLRLLQKIFASSHRLILLRRRLALACFFRDIAYLRQHRDKSLNLKSITRHLEGPEFIISNTTDYGELAATIGILSIAVDCGDPPSSSCVTEETAFNRDIDTLSSRIKSMFADIVDTGASHMGRTEAKEVLEAFQYWLSYGVRTKAPPKKSLFGDSTLEGIADRNMMEAYVERVKQNTSFALPDGV